MNLAAPRWALSSVPRHANVSVDSSRFDHGEFLFVVLLTVECTQALSIFVRPIP